MQYIFKSSETILREGVDYCKSLCVSVIFWVEAADCLICHYYPDKHDILKCRPRMSEVMHLYHVLE